MKKEKEPAKKEINPAILQALRNQTTQVCFADSVDEEKPLSYVLAKNGLFLVKRSNIAMVQIPLSKVEVNAPGLPEMVAGWDPYLPLIPFSLFCQAISFLKAAKEKYQTEALVRFYWNERKGDWIMVIPPQITTGASVEIQDGLEGPPDSIFAAEIHSHPGSSSSFSGIDDAHEQFDRMFMCVAFPKDAPPSFHARVGVECMDKWLDLDIQEIVDFSSMIEIPLSALFTKGDPFPYTDFPQEWLKRVTPKVMKQPSARFTVQDHRRINGSGGVYGDWERRMKERQRREQEEVEAVEGWLREHRDVLLLPADVDFD